MNIKTLVKNNVARFSFYREGELYYDVLNEDGKKIAQFPVRITDRKEIGNAKFSAEEKAITLMRYIRKAKEKDELVIFKS